MADEKEPTVWGTPRVQWWDQVHSTTLIADCDLEKVGLKQCYTPRDKSALAVVFVGPELPGKVAAWLKYTAYDADTWYYAARRVNEKTWSFCDAERDRKYAIHTCRVFNNGAGQKKKERVELEEGLLVHVHKGVEYRVGDVVFFEPNGCELGGCLYRVVGGSKGNAHILPTFQLGQTADIDDAYMHPRKVGWSQVKKACLKNLMEEAMRLKIFVNEEIKREASVLKKIREKKA